jgi:hypothetical protein
MARLAMGEAGGEGEIDPGGRGTSLTLESRGGRGGGGNALRAALVGGAEEGGTEMC